MPQLIGLVVALGLAGLIVGLILAAVYIFVVYILPFLVVGGALVWYLRHPYRRLRDRYAFLADRVNALSIPSSDTFLQSFAERFVGALKEAGLSPPLDEVCVVLLETVGTLYQQEDFPARFVLPPAPEWQWRLRPDYYRLKARLDEIEAALDQRPKAVTEFSDVCADALALFTAALPTSALQTWEAFHESDGASGSALAVPACELMHDVPNLVGHLVALFAASVNRAAGVFERLIASYDRAVVEVSSKELTQSQLQDGQYVSPDIYQGTPAELVRAYLSQTAWYEPFMTPIPFSFGEARFQHEWIVAPTGSGKTQLLKAQIASDLPSVGRGEASIVVMDSQGTKPGTLVGDLIRLKAFAPGGELEGRLVFLDPDPAFPLALNLFDFGFDALHNLSERARRSYLSSATDLTEFIINGLVGAEQTPMMKGISRFIIQALMAVPDATIRTFQDFMRKGGWQKYRDHIDTLDDYTKEFFYERFDTDQYTATKNGIFWRIDTMMANPTFREMFLNPRNRLDLGKELKAAKVIVVNTDRELLKADGTEAFGRLILAKLLLATEGRASEPNPLPTYVYIDEAQDYIHSEERIADVIDKARKQKVGFIFAHQRLANIRAANVLDALANTAIHFAGGNRSDAAVLSRSMHTQPEFIESQPALHFAAYVKGQTDHAVQIRVPFGLMEAMPKMTAEEFDLVRADMRDRYAVRRSGTPPRRPTPEAPITVADAPTKWET